MADWRDRFQDWSTLLPLLVGVTRMLNTHSNVNIFYSLRTSETNYLNEAFSFYAAIRGRAYYGRTGRDER